MAQDFSFDIVSKTEMQEVANAVQQAQKELGQRFDFKGSKSSIELTGEELILISDDEGKLRSVKDILETKLVKRHVALKAIDYQTIEAAAMGTVRQRAKIVQGIEIEKAKAEDPRILRQRVAELERHLKASEARTVAPAPPPAPIEVPVLTPATLQELEGIAEQTVAAINEVNRIRTELGQVWTLVKESLESARILSVRVSRPTAIPVSTSAPPVTPRRTMPADRNIRISKSANSAPLGAGERRILIAIAQHPAGVTREQLTVLTGYKRSSRDTYLQRLGSQGLILVTPEAILATDAGVDALGSAFELLPTGDELRRHWLGRLTGGERTHPRGGLLRVPERGRPGTLSRRNRATSAPAATPYIQRLAQRKLVHVVGRGELRASEELFG